MFVVFYVSVCLCSLVASLHTYFCVFFCLFVCLCLVMVFACFVYICLLFSYAICFLSVLCSNFFSLLHFIQFFFPPFFCNFLHVSCRLCWLCLSCLSSFFYLSLLPKNIIDPSSPGRQGDATAHKRRTESQCTGWGGQTAGPDSESNHKEGVSSFPEGGSARGGGRQGWHSGREQVRTYTSSIGISKQERIGRMREKRWTIELWLCSFIFFGLFKWKDTMVCI